MTSLPNNQNYKFLCLAHNIQKILSMVHNKTRSQRPINIITRRYVSPNENRRYVYHMSPHGFGLFALNVKDCVGSDSNEIKMLFDWIDESLKFESLKYGESYHMMSGINVDTPMTSVHRTSVPSVRQIVELSVDADVPMTPVHETTDLTADVQMTPIDQIIDTTHDVPMTRVKQIIELTQDIPTTQINQTIQQIPDAQKLIRSHRIYSLEEMNTRHPYINHSQPDKRHIDSDFSQTNKRYKL